MELGLEARAVALDELLDHLPPGFIPAADVGHGPSAVPRYLHPATALMFHLVLGDEVLLGMSPARLDRVDQVQALDHARRLAGEEEFEVVQPRAVPPLGPMRVFTPVRRLVAPPLLVGEPAGRHLLHRLGVPESSLHNWGVRPAGVGAALRGLAQVGLRAPSEAEWEFVVRAAMDDLDDGAPRRLPPPDFVASSLGAEFEGRGFLTTLGRSVELCRDSWHPSWEGAPGDAGAWGEGHEVVRGGGPGSLYTGSFGSDAWTECVWPSRRRVAAEPGPVLVRPVASLR
jgi:hypothetical protein